MTVDALSRVAIWSGSSLNNLGDQLIRSRDGAATLLVVTWRGISALLSVEPGITSGTPMDR